MKLSTLLNIFAVSVLAIAAVTSCKNGPLTQQQAAADALSLAASTANGFMAGGKAGALLGFTTQEVKNLENLAAKANATVAANPAPSTLLPTISPPAVTGGKAPSSVLVNP